MFDIFDLIVDGDVVGEALGQSERIEIHWENDVLLLLLSAVPVSP